MAEKAFLLAFVLTLGIVEPALAQAGNRPPVQQATMDHSFLPSLTCATDTCGTPAANWWSSGASVKNPWYDLYEGLRAEDAKNLEANGFVLMNLDDGGSFMMSDRSDMIATSKWRVSGALDAHTLRSIGLGGYRCYPFNDVTLPSARILSPIEFMTGGGGGTSGIYLSRMSPSPYHLTSTSLGFAATASCSGTLADQIQIWQAGSDDAWTAAADQLMQAIDAVRPLTPAERQKCKTEESGKSARQRFELRLRLLQIIAR